MLLWVLVAIVLAYLVFPVFIVAPVSFSSAKYLQFPPPGWSLQWYENYFARPGWVPATLLSIRVALITAVLATILGTAASLALVRGRFPGRNAINSFMVSPLVVPGIIVAIGVYFFYAQARLVGNPLGSGAGPHRAGAPVRGHQRLGHAARLRRAARVRRHEPWRQSLADVSPGDAADHPAGGASPGRCSPSSSRSTS